MRIAREVWYDEEENDDGHSIACTRAKCSRCGHETLSFGDGEASKLRCLVLLREECPEEEQNFYVSDRDE